MAQTLKSTKHLVRLGLYTAIALTIFILEAQLPPLFTAVPGIKLGLSNIVTLFLLTCETKRDAALVLLARILLGCFFTGQMMTLIYSLAGGLLSFGIMALCSWLFKREVLWFTGMAGGVFHNLGQIVTAAVLMQTWAVLYYLPVLVLCGMAAGLFSGFSAMFFAKRYQALRTGRQKKT